MTEEDDLLKIKKKRLHEPVTPLQHKVLNSLYEFSQGERRVSFRENANKNERNEEVEVLMPTSPI